MFKTLFSWPPQLFLAVTAGVLLFAACSSTPTDTPVPPFPTQRAPTPPPTSTPTPKPTPAPTSTPTPTPKPPPTITPAPEPVVLEFCEYAQGANVLTAGADGESVAGVITTGRCANFNLDDSARDAEDILSVTSGDTISFAFDGAAAAAYALDVHGWPTGRPSFGRFAPEQPLDRFIGFPLSADSSYPNFEYIMAQEPGDYRIVVNAAWSDGGQVVFAIFRVEVR